MVHGESSHDLFVGNIPRSKPPYKINQNWQANAVDTRQQKINKGKPCSALKVPKSNADTVDPQAMKLAQKENPSESRVRQYVLQNVVHLKNNGNVTWHEKHDLLFREFSMNNGRVFSQFVVPQKFREDVMRIALDSFLVGHMGIQRTVTTVTSEFFWPDEQSDVRRFFFQSCDICQRTLQKSKVSRIPLERMLLIKEPFQ